MVVGDINGTDVIYNVVVENNIIDPNTTNARAREWKWHLHTPSATQCVISNNTIGNCFQSGIYLLQSSNNIAYGNTLNGHAHCLRHHAGEQFQRQRVRQ